MIAIIIKLCLIFYAHTESNTEVNIHFQNLISFLIGLLILFLQEGEEDYIKTNTRRQRRLRLLQTIIRIVLLNTSNISIVTKPVVMTLQWPGATRTVFALYAPTSPPTCKPCPTFSTSQPVLLSVRWLWWKVIFDSVQCINNQHGTEHESYFQIFQIFLVWVWIILTSFLLINNQRQESKCAFSLCGENEEQGFWAEFCCRSWRFDQSQAGLQCVFNPENSQSQSQASQC